MDLVGTYKTREFDEDIRAVADLGGPDVIVEKLNSDKNKGITEGDLYERGDFYGDNNRDDLVAQHCCMILKDALDDFMLKLLIFIAIISIACEEYLAYQ